MRDRVRALSKEGRGEEPHRHLSRLRPLAPPGGARRGRPSEVVLDLRRRRSGQPGEDGASATSRWTLGASTSGSCSGSSPDGRAPLPGSGADSGRDRVPDDDYEAIADQLLPRYEQALRAQRSLDFDDLMVRPVALLAADRAMRRAYRERFRHVLVDEFQDTNRVQLRLLELLCGEDVPRERAVAGRRTSDAGSRAPAAGRRPVPDVAVDRRGRPTDMDGPKPLRGRGRRPGNLRLARRRRAQHPPIREALPGRDDRAPRAELSLLGPHPGLRERGHRPLGRPAAEAALDRRRARRPGPGRRTPGRAGGGAIRRGRGRPRSGERAQARRISPSSTA